MNHVVLLSIIISTLIMVLPVILLLIKSIKKSKKLNINKLDFKNAIVGQRVTWKYKNKYKYIGKIIEIDTRYSYPIKCTFIMNGITHTERFKFDGSDENKYNTLSYTKLKSKQNFKNAKIGQKVNLHHYDNVLYIGTIIDIQTTQYTQYPITCRIDKLSAFYKFSIEGIGENVHTKPFYIEYHNKIISILNYINNIINNIKHDFRPFEKPKLKINKINKEKIQVKTQPEVKIIITNN